MTQASASECYIYTTAKSLNADEGYYGKPCWDMVRNQYRDKKLKGFELVGEVNGQNKFKAVFE